jgi:hypothetical protein
MLLGTAQPSIGYIPAIYACKATLFGEAQELQNALDASRHGSILD